MASCDEKRRPDLGAADKTLLACVLNQLVAASEFELPHEVGSMRVDRAWADHKAVGDFAV